MKNTNSIKKLTHNQIKRFVKTGVAMAGKATTMAQLERLYNSYAPYTNFICERMGTGAYNDSQYENMRQWVAYLGEINTAVIKNIKRVEALQKEAS